MAASPPPPPSSSSPPPPLPSSPPSSPPSSSSPPPSSYVASSSPRSCYSYSSSSSSTSSSVEGSSLIQAADSGNIENLKNIIVDIGDDEEIRRRCDEETDVDGVTVLHYVAAHGLIDMCTYLVNEVGVNIDVQTFKGDTPLLVAMKIKQPVVAKYLIENGADVTKTTSKGHTALHWAVIHGDLELIELLLMKGADIEADSVGGTPLHYAAKHGKVESLRILLSNQAKPNAICKRNGSSPLTFAISSGSAECAQLLLEAEADPNHIVHELSPLAHAAIRKTKCIESLLEKNADVDLITRFGWRAVEHAVWAKNHEAVAMLFPLTRNNHAYPEWTVDYITKDIHSKEQKERRKDLRFSRRLDINKAGNDALNKKDYSTAVKWYNEVVHVDPYVEKVLAKRSLCWERLGEGVLALYDAELCAILDPNWATAHYRVGCAWNLLKNYRMAHDAFKRAFELDSNNEEIRKAYSCSLQHQG